jgi:hypothetical protein
MGAGGVSWFTVGKREIEIEREREREGVKIRVRVMVIYYITIYTLVIYYNTCNFLVTWLTVGKILDVFSFFSCSVRGFTGNGNL